jgi:hypothetical protein
VFQDVSVKSLYLHIGYNKAGSSSLQRFLAGNRQALMHDSILYPQLGLHDSAHYGVSKTIFDLPRSDAVACSDDFAGQLADEIAGSGCDSVIISSEYLSCAWPKQIEKVKDFFELVAGEFLIRPVVYLRRHDLWFESLFNQAEKSAPVSPWAMDVKDYILYVIGSFRPSPDYIHTVNIWGSVFGEKNLIVRPFESSQFFENNFIQDFFSACDLPFRSNWDGADLLVNESLTSQQLIRVGLAKRGLTKSAFDQYREFSEASRKARGVPYGKLSNEYRHSICQLFRPQYAQLAKRFLKKKSLFFEEMPTR